MKEHSLFEVKFFCKYFACKINYRPFKAQILIVSMYLAQTILQLIYQVRVFSLFRILKSLDFQTNFYALYPLVLYRTRKPYLEKLNSKLFFTQIIVVIRFQIHFKFIFLKNTNRYQRIIYERVKTDQIRELLVLLCTSLQRRICCREQQFLVNVHNLYIPESL